MIFQLENSNTVQTKVIFSTQREFTHACTLEAERQNKIHNNVFLAYLWN